MKPCSIALMDLMAAQRAAQLQEEIARYAAAAAQALAQHELLEAYRARLAASWQGGAPVLASQARRANHFAAGAHSAQAQLAQAGTNARAQLDAASIELAGLKSRRRKLAAKAVAESSAAAAQAEQLAAQERPWRRP